MTWLKEIWRSKIKFLMLAAAVGLLFFLLVFVNTLSSTLLDSFIGALENTSADLLVYDSEAQATIPASRLTFEDVDAVAEIEGVAGTAPISVLTNDASTNGERVEMSLWGIDPSGPGAPAEIVEGAPPGPYQAVVDTSALDEGLDIGSNFEVGGVSIEVVGVAENATYSVLPTAYLDHDTWNEVFVAIFPDAPATPINMAGVAIESGSDAAQVGASISAIDGLEALKPSEAASSTPGVSSIEQSFGIITGITFVIVIIIVGFFFQILTVQNLNVFTLLRAIGARARSVAAYVFGQIGFVVTLGVVIGVLMLIVTAFASRDFFAIDLDPVLIGLFAGAILLASLLSGLTSLNRIRKQDPALAASGEQS